MGGRPVLVAATVSVIDTDLLLSIHWNGNMACALRAERPARDCRGIPRSSTSDAKSMGTITALAAFLPTPLTYEWVATACGSAAGVVAVVSSAANRFSVRSGSTGSPRSQRVNWLTISPAAIDAV